MSTTARERARAYLRTPADGRAWILGIVGGFVGMAVVAAVAALLGVEDSFAARLGLAVALGVLVGLALRVVGARRRRTAPPT